MSTPIIYPPTQDGLQKTLSAQLLTGVTASATLSNVTGIQNMKGLMVIDRVDANNNLTPNKREYITFSSVSGSTVVTLTRGLAGSTDQDHAVGAIVEFVNDVVQQQAIIDGLLLTVKTDGTLNKAAGSDINTGTSDTTIVTPKAIADSTIARTIATATENATGTDNAKYLTALANVPAFNNSLSRQALINGNFVVNQRVYASGATLAAGVYGHDRWKAGVSGGDYTFTQLASSTQITIASAKSLIQVIEDKNIVGGTYTLSWTGTAQARYSINSATPAGSYATSPIAITGQTAGTVMSVEFNTGTLSNVQLNSGTVALPFMPKSYEEELRACKRYCQAIIAGTSEFIGHGHANDTTHAAIHMPLPVEMRIVPALTATASDWVLSDFQNADIDLTVIELRTNSRKNLAVIYATVASGLTQYRPYHLMADTTAGRVLILSAEL